MARFTLRPTPLDGLHAINRQCAEDNRGFFSRFFCAAEFEGAGIGLSVAQINHTLTRSRGAVRGLHFQFSPHAEMKYVSCLKGEVFDVAVDLRRGSRTFLQWHGEHLSEYNHASLLIPQGFAHGFQALCDGCELIYVHSADYQPESEGGVHPLDPFVGIRWPLPFTDISPRDEQRAFLTPNFTGI